MYKIVLRTKDVKVDMPKDIGLGLFEACWRADLYKKKNPQATFMVVNLENGDIDYEV